MKKQLLFIFALVMCLPQAFAQAFDVGNLSYNVINSTKLTVSVTGFVPGQETEALIIPEKVTDANTSIEYTVVRVVPAAFYNNATGGANNIITSISLPGSINYLAFNAFRSLTNLTSINFAPSNLDTSLVKMENFVFAGCTSLTSVDLTGVNVNIGHGTSGANKQGSNVFNGCTSLTSFTLKNNAQSSRIFTGFFNGCTSLETVDFSGTAISIISPLAFANCTALKTMYLGSDVPPATVNSNSFDGIVAPIAGGTLFVPTATGVSAYTNDTVFDWDAYFTIAAGTTLSTNKHELTPSFKLFPNPATNTIRVSKKVVSAIIYSTLGKEIRTFNNQKEFDISNLSNGLYLFKAKFENNTTETIRFVKQ
ncbi:leucine-rich repeat domain-containing protein [Algibacter sp. L3A6]|uniref:leucine-rich repeat domain-containing protein n=1 Tax=Algibacter sp. L3A6 TaxID=2686366 RepID=UPI00131D802C|nr:leucine-rich repeat domain-containing protein [Algibacter sp. L3A6]